MLKTMLTPDFIGHEIDAITEKWREIQKGSERKGEGLAIFYRLRVHPDLWRGIREFLDSLSTEVASRSSFPKLSFWSSRSTAILQSKVGSSCRSPTYRRRSDSNFWLANLLISVTLLRTFFSRPPLVLPVVFVPGVAYLRPQFLPR
jgi:hypothetical protein